MAAAKKTTKPRNVKATVVAKKTPKTTKELQVQNSAYADTMLAAGAAGVNAICGQSQLSQTDTLFKNVRGYQITNNYILLGLLYAENGIVETLIDIPVEDSLRGGFEITTKQLSEDQRSALVKDMNFKGDVEEVKYAEKWKRLYGGAGLITLDSDSEANKPFDITKVQKGKTIIEFKAADLWELNAQQTPHEYDTNVKEITESERLSQGNSGFFNYYNQAVSRGRVIVLKGKRAPAQIRARLRGWGLSEIEALVRSLNQYLKTTDLSFEVLDEFKIDVYKFAGLVDALQSDAGMKLIQERVTVANMQKGYQNGIALDATDDYQQKQVSFVGIADVMKEIKLQVAADLRIPVTKLFGQSAAGFNSGEDDIENYNAMVESRIRPGIVMTLTEVAKIRCMQAHGFVPDDLEIVLKPLRIMSSKEEEEIKTAKFNRVIQAKTQGEMTTKEFREACNKDQLLGIKVKENISEDLLHPPELEPDPDEEDTDNGR